MQKFDAEFESLIVRLYRKLRSSDKVARRLQIGKTSVCRSLKRQGIDLPVPGQARPSLYRFKGREAAAVVAAYAGGEPVEALTNKYRCSIQAIRNAVLRAGGTIRPAGGMNRIRRWTDIEKKKICDLYADGWTQHNLAVRFSTSQSIISKILIHAGAKVRDRHNRLEKHGSWKGGRSLISGGYIGVLLDRNDPLFCMARFNGYIAEHRLILARSLSRPLSKSETVHHINGNKTDNRLENLQLRQGHHGSGTVARCADCGSHNITRVSIA